MPNDSDFIFKCSKGHWRCFVETSTKTGERNVHVRWYKKPSCLLLIHRINLE